MKDRGLLRFGLKWNPFTPDIPTEGCRLTPDIEHFSRRVEALSRTGGFALITGEPGMGKSVAQRLLVDRLEGLPEVAIRALSRPQASIADLYRELGDLYAVELKPNNRWIGSKILRAQWKAHIEASMYRAILVIDEAQEADPKLLRELRLLSSSQLDSRSLLTVVLAGDGRLVEKLRRPDLLPLGSRIRVRLHLQQRSAEELLEFLRHVMREAGNPALMTEELQRTLSERSLGNPRVLTNLAAELLEAAIERKVKQLDEALYLEVFAVPTEPSKQRKGTSRRRRR